MPEAQVLIDSVGYKPYPDGKTRDEKRETRYASHGEVVEDMPQSEFERLASMGAVASPGSDEAKMTRDEAVAAAHLGPHGSAEAGPPLPGQTAAQIEELVKSRDGEKPAMPNTNEAYPTVASADNESPEQREAREASEAAAEKAAKASQVDEKPGDSKYESRAGSGRKAAAEANDK